MFSKNFKDNNFVLFFSVLAILIFRLVLTFAIPLLDKTEARYAEISRLMYETKEWIVVQIDYGFPFWAIEQNLIALCMRKAARLSFYA